MIITCDNCGTNYQIKESDISDEGREVRCTHCEHIWFQPPFSFENNSPHMDDHQQDSIEKEQKSTHLKWLQRSIVLLSLLIATALFFAPKSYISPVMRPLYSIFGIYDSSQLEFDNATFEQHYTNNHHEILIKANIINNGREAKVLPNMKITFYDGEGKSLSATYLINNNQDIKPGETVAIIKTVNQPPQESKYITLDIGNKLELWLQ